MQIPKHLQAAFQKGASYCAYQERCHKQVDQHLQKKLNLTEDERIEIIYHLIQENFLNEERFAQTYARGKFRFKQWGRNRIKQELKFKQVSERNIQTALKEIDTNDYFTTLKALLVKKKESINESHPLKRKKKLADFAIRKGFESHLVFEILLTCPEIGLHKF